MLLDAIIIVLRESLEAGILISLLLALGNRLQLGLRWFAIAVPLGLTGAVLYAANLGSISEWFDYVGQEVVNGTMQYVLYLLLLSVIFFAGSASERQRKLVWIMAATVALAMVREGAEIIIFYSGFLHKKEQLSTALTSGFIGLTIGVSVGALSYFLVMTLKRRQALIVQITVLVMVAAGMVAQATQLLIQADWLPSALPVWNSSNLLSEESVSGQLAYAIFGYEAAPSALELGFYLSALGIAIVTACFQKLRRTVRS